MKRLLSLVLCFLFMFSTQVNADNLGNWEFKSDTTLAKYESATVSANGKLYNIGGHYWTSVPIMESLTQEYDPATNKWIKKANMPTARGMMGAATVGNKIYVIGGAIRNSSGVTYLKTVEEYDTTTDTWTKRSDMPTARCALGIIELNGKIYAIGGNNANGSLKTVEEYNPIINTWVKKTDMPTAKGDVAIATYNGKIYIIGGGYTNQSKTTLLKTVEEYDPITDTWTQKADMPTARATSAALASNRIYAIGGWIFNDPISQSATIPTNKVEEYNPLTNTWRAVKSLNVARYHHGTTELNGKIYVVEGGGNGIYLRSVEAFTPPLTIEINLTASAGNAVVNLNWETSIDATGYVVKRSTTPGGPYDVIATDVTTKSYADNKVQNGTTYYYVVTALENGAETTTSNEASATPTAGESPGTDPDITGNRALLVITMTNGNRKEYDMSASEIKAFVNWYDARTNGSGLKYYIINKNYNIGPFVNRKDHIVFDQISDFEIMEYNK